MSNQTVAVLMGVIFAGIIAIDVWLALDAKPGNTFSARLRSWGKAWPPTRLLICFGMGLLAGHWWWIVMIFCGIQGQWPSSMTG